MKDVYVAGVGMTRFGKYPDRSLKQLGATALDAVLDDAGLALGDLDAAYVANSVAGIVTGQEAIRGQTVLNSYGLGDVPVFNIENACASSSSAVHLAWQSVALGLNEVVLILGVEKLFHPDRSVSYRALGSALDVEEHPADSASSPFLAHASAAAEKYLADIGGDITTLAAVAARAHYRGSLNPYAQYRDVYTEDEVLASPAVSGILTRLMCAPIGDGAAALVISSRRPEGDRPAVRIAGSAVSSARVRGADNGAPIAARVAQRALATAGLAASDVDVAEVHDTTAVSEIRLSEEIGLISREDLVPSVRAGTTRYGTVPVVNPSGGLLSRGHPVGATGAAQLVELTWQLRGEAGDRQVENAAVALAQNGGGKVADESAAMVVTILQRVD